MNTRQLLQLKKKKEKAEQEYSDLIRELNESCHHPKKYIKYRSVPHNDEYGCYWYTTHIHDCELCGQYLGQYKETEYSDQIR